MIGIAAVDNAEAGHPLPESFVEQLVQFGPYLRFPLCSDIHGSRHAHMRELRIQHHGRPFRILYAFNPRRSAILLTGGEKTGDDRWYERMVPVADALYDEHLRELAAERWRGHDDGEEH